MGTLQGRNLRLLRTVSKYHMKRKWDTPTMERFVSNPQKDMKNKSENREIEYKNGHGARYHRIPDSLRAFCRIVSFTVTKTSLMLDVSVAWVILHLRAG